MQGVQIGEESAISENFTATMPGGSDCDFPYKEPADEEQAGAAKNEAVKDTALVPAAAR